MTHSDDETSSGDDPARMPLSARLEQEAARLRGVIEEARAREDAIRADCVLDVADAGVAEEAVLGHRREVGAARARLEQIHEAQARLEDGTYGLCANCAEPIDPERLEAVPLTRLCSACAVSQNPR